MHKRRLNSARLRFEIEPRGPVLIKSGVETPDPTRPSMEFVRTRHRELGESVYIPGTSLKGALRSHAERCLRGQGVPVCATFKNRSPQRRGRPWSIDSDACMDRPKPGSSAALFSQQCPVCRTFGSLHVSGRANISDAYPWAPDAQRSEQQASVAYANSTEKRFQIGIDRQSGQVHRGALFDLEVLVQGTFHAELQLHDFQLWQLGLLGVLLRDMDRGDLPLGFGKTRGLGQVAVRATSLSIRWAHSDASFLAGTAFLGGDHVQGYGLYGIAEEDRLQLPESGTSTWRGSEIDIEDISQVQELLGSLASQTLPSMIRHLGGRT